MPIVPCNKSARSWGNRCLRAQFSVWLPSSAVCLVTTNLCVVLLTRSLLYVIGDDVPVEEVSTASAHDVEAHMAAGHTADRRKTISVSTLKEFTAALRYNAYIRLRVCVRKCVCMVGVLFVCFMRFRSCGCVRMFVCFHSGPLPPKKAPKPFYLPSISPSASTPRSRARG